MFDISNTRSILGLAQKHIWYIIEDIVFRNWTFLLFSNTISLIVFQICFKANHSHDGVFKISKIIQSFDYIDIFQDLYCRTHKTATLTPIQHTVSYTSCSSNIWWAEMKGFSHFSSTFTLILDVKYHSNWKMITK